MRCFDSDLMLSFPLLDYKPFKGKDHVLYLCVPTD